MNGREISRQVFSILKIHIDDKDHRIIMPDIKVFAFPCDMQEI